MSAPVPVRVPGVPLQIAISAAETVSAATLITLTVSVLRQPLASVPVTVYIVVTVGLATGLAQAVQDNPVPGDQV